MANELAGKYEGTVLICGSAPSLYADYQEALRSRPNAAVIAINDAASVIHAEFLATLHPEDARHFSDNSKNTHIRVISGQRHHPDHHDVDYWFDGCNSGATTAGSAIKMAKAMGFEEIILCGCPMEGGDGYFNAAPKVNKTMMATRFGHSPKGGSVVQQHQENLKREFAGEGWNIVSSMSGFTQRYFGAPVFIKGKAA